MFGRPRNEYWDDELCDYREQRPKDNMGAVVAVLILVILIAAAVPLGLNLDSNANGQPHRNVTVPRLNESGSSPGNLTTPILLSSSGGSTPVALPPLRPTHFHA
ncbi:hypothetical protein GGS20DRAFT_587677 [Poronia punctata]|nr:hypothetical protein GGS20DRAFT_587677 [Poronia punctata]